MRVDITRAAVLTAAIFAAAPILAAQGSSGFFGRSLQDLAGEDFFSFFHLSETGRERDAAGGAAVTFQPGGMFRQFARVVVRLDAAGKAIAIEARLDRAFVDGSMSGIFASDIVKSLLRDAPPTADRKAIASLAQEIEFRRSEASSGSAAAIPAAPSAGYLTFMGKQKRFDQALARSSISLENTTAEGKAILIVAVRSTVRKKE